MAPSYQTTKQAEPDQVPEQDLTNALAGARFPTTRRRLVEQARTNDAPRPVVRAIEELPDKEYDTLADVRRIYRERNQAEPPRSRTGTSEGAKEDEGAQEGSPTERSSGKPREGTGTGKRAGTQQGRRQEGTTR